MSTLAIAKKDFRDAIRSNELWALIGLFALFLSGTMLYEVTDTAAVNTGYYSGVSLSMTFVLSVFVPAAALLVSVTSIARERSRGTVAFLLALPHTRGEVYVGLLLGRLAVFTTAIVAGYLPAFLIFSIGIGGFEPLPFVGRLVPMVCLGATFLAVGHSASALTTSGTVATISGFTVFFLMYGWNAFFSTLNALFGLVDGNVETFVTRLQLQLIASDIVKAIASLGMDDIDSASVAVSNGGDVPFYLQHWFAVVPLAFLICVPLALGYWRFTCVEL